MKSLILLLAIYFIFSILFSQEGWTKYASNPVLDVGPPGSWHDQGVLASYVIFEGATYHMWYIGDAGNVVKLGYATLSDGIIWIKFAGNPILFEGLQGRCEEGGPGSPTVIFDGTIYHM